tara:strand:- start:332 stop:490 length:159 start_codon:yes stop_codon:yes gene_type:complete
MSVKPQASSHKLRHFVAGQFDQVSSFKLRQFVKYLSFNIYGKVSFKNKKRKV